ITKIDGKPTAAHIHKGRPGVSGPVYIAFGTTFKRQGCTTAPTAKIIAVAAKPSAFYVNVHNAKHLGGAMRGQLKTVLEFVPRGPGAFCGAPGSIPVSHRRIPARPN